MDHVDYAHLQVSWRRYHARCRRADRLKSYAALSSGTFALHNLSARMHRAEALYFHDEAARRRVYDSPRVGFIEAYARLYGIRLRRSIELQRGIVRVRTPTVGSSNIAWGKTVYFSRLWRCPRKRRPWPDIPSTTTLSRYKDRAAHTAPSVESTPVVEPPGDTVSIPAIPSAVQRLLIWDLLAQLSSLVSLLGIYGPPVCFL